MELCSDPKLSVEKTIFKSDTYDRVAYIRRKHLTFASSYTLVKLSRQTYIFNELN